MNNFQKWLQKLILLSEVYDSSHSSLSLPTLGIILPSLSQVGKGIVLSHCGFNLYFTDKQVRVSAFFIRLMAI